MEGRKGGPENGIPLHVVGPPVLVVCTYSICARAQLTACGLSEANDRKRRRRGNPIRCLLSRSDRSEEAHTPKKKTVAAAAGSPSGKK